MCRIALVWTVPDDWLSHATGDTTCGELARSVDWTATPLGDTTTWPHSLRAAVRLCFSTGFPVLLAWGPELTMIYNDGYAAMLGSLKHPGAMGAPLQAVWLEVWADIAPLIDSVMTSGRPYLGKDVPSASNAPDSPRRRPSRSPTAPSVTATTSSAGLSTSRSRRPTRS